jgi:hypothetical protein
VVAHIVSAEYDAFGSVMRAMAGISLEFQEFSEKCLGCKRTRIAGWGE